MKSRYPAWQKSTVCLVIAVTTLFVSLTVAFATDGRPYVNYGQLSAEWWEWILEQSLTSNPNLDATGADAGNGQPRDDVFFIAGTFGGSANRAFTVPTESALFLPLLNNLAAVPLPAPRPKPDVNQVPQAREINGSFIAGVTELHVMLNGQSLVDSIVRAESPVFKFIAPDDAILPGTWRGLSDGYWLYIPPLPPGTYVLNFGGTGNGLSVEVTDTITVQ